MPPRLLALASPKLLVSITNGARSGHGEGMKIHLPIGFEKIIQNCIVL